MAEQRIAVRDIELCYETFGDPGDPAILLVMGLGTQMLAWREDFCEALVAEGFYVVRYDNRDVGHSTHFSASGLRALPSSCCAGRGTSPTRSTTWPTTLLPSSRGSGSQRRTSSGPRWAA
jgi:pimeloyl-ACP methyl ester carboxylesterase